MNKLKRNRIKELYRNRPTVYIPEVVKMMKKHPLIYFCIQNGYRLYTACVQNGYPG